MTVRDDTPLLHRRCYAGELVGDLNDDVASGWFYVAGAEESLEGIQEGACARQFCRYSTGREARTGDDGFRRPCLGVEW